MRFGARIFKTGLTVILALYASIWLNLEPPVLAAIAAALSIQPSVYRSWKNGLEQVQSNIIGAIIATLFTLFLGNGPLIIAMVVMLVIGINLQLKYEKSTQLAVVTVLAMMTVPKEEFLQYGLDRFFLILIGVLSSLAINIIFFRPQYEKRLFAQHKQLMEQIALSLRFLLDPARDAKESRKDIQEMKKLQENTQNLYLLLQEEKTYFQKTRFSQWRKLVVYREMLKLADEALRFLEKAEHHRTALEHLPPDLQEALLNWLERMASEQERIYLLFEKKLREARLDGEEHELQPLPLAPFLGHPEVLPVLLFAEEYLAQLRHVGLMVQQLQTSQEPHPEQSEPAKPASKQE
ncbi:MAG: hypothetical protein BAA01_01650 [Bacillus thermozeamaize]|jgi:uncharacterized membrane protein YgaE (UPF0421/DUF939 family)|uniref:Uncharacterized protein n=1 Tax=Bacillus thermozeamaize TaxID=230954 RepID=A0A1Y3PIV8_9BACI|nr:MAG: hypothetical protein BAA01_01650 [Bacillus thermozeamaize]